MPFLKILKGPSRGTAFRLIDSNDIGRLTSCRIVLPEPTVSKRHAIIRKIEGVFHVEDVKSKSGTTLNGKQIKKPNPLKDGDRIRICDYTLAFYEHDSDKGEEEEEDEEESSSLVIQSVLDESSEQVLTSQPVERLAMLLKLGAELTQTFDLNQLLPRAVERLFAVFPQADRVFVILREAGRLTSRVSKTRRPDDADTRFSRTIVNRVLETEKSVLIEDTNAPGGLDQSASITDYRIRSVMCVPLIGRGSAHPFGAIQLDTREKLKFNNQDLKLLLAVAGQAALAIENAGMHVIIVEQAGIVRELKLARAMQQSFLPKRMPEVAGYEFAAIYEAAQEVGGDYYDFIPLPGQRLGIMVGDVAGKGISAALLMAKVSGEMRYCALAEPTLSGMITLLNAQLQEAGELDRFVTLIAGVLDPARHEVTFANAGHPPPLIYRHATGAFEPGIGSDQTGLPLGIGVGDKPYACNTVALDPGDCIVMLSDGIYDSQSKDDRSFKSGVMGALQAGVMTPRALVDRLIAAVHQHAAGRKPFDDLTVVAFGRIGPLQQADTVH
jgi:sigma-B regulation protein RsbU (phosphoserine phosphatase)